MIVEIMTGPNGHSLRLDGKCLDGMDPAASELIAKLNVQPRALVAALFSNYKTDRRIKDAIAEAIYADGSDLCDTAWAGLSKEKKVGWLGDAERVVKCLASLKAA